MPPSSGRPSTLSPEYAFLGFLTQQPAHGYELHQQLVANLGQLWHISLSQAYNILNRLETQGYIAGTLQEQDKLPARRRFRITAKGRRHFDEWLHSPLGTSVRVVRVEFITRLYFACAADSEVARELLETQTTETHRGLNRLQDILLELPAEQTFNRLGLELRIRQLKSLLEWLSECRSALSL